MEKTKLGITISLFGGALYFIGMVSIFPLVLLAGYVLLMEENQWLKRVAVKAVAVVLFFAVLQNLVGLLSDSSSFIFNIAALFNRNPNLAQYNRIISLLRIIISVISTITMLLLGFKALKMGDVGVGPVDKLVDKNR